MELGLKGKVALVTGGSKGIGYGIADRLAAEGCNVVLVARNEAELADARTRLTKEYKVDVKIKAADLSSEPDRVALAKAFPDVDILVNNAGAIRHGTLDAVDNDLWRQYWELKVFGYINLSREYFVRMKERPKGGVILNIVGVAGHKMDFGYIAGSTGNASLVAFTKALGSKSPDFNVRCLGISPGPVLTAKLELRMRGEAKAKGLDPEKWRDLMVTFPFGRAATHQELGDVAAFLVSDRAAYISGTVLTVDGGWTQRWSI